MRVVARILIYFNFLQLLHVVLHSLMFMNSMSSSSSPISSRFQRSLTCYFLIVSVGVLIVYPNYLNRSLTMYAWFSALSISVFVFLHISYSSVILEPSIVRIIFLSILLKSSSCFSCVLYTFIFVLLLSFLYACLPF